MKIKSNNGVILRYSEAFKLKVVEEIEKEHLTIPEAMTRVKQCQFITYCYAVNYEDTI